MTATYTQQQLNAPVTLSSLTAFLTSIFEGLGGSLYDSWVSNNQYLVFKFAEDSNTKGVVYVYLNINASGNSFSFAIYDSWTIANHSGTNPATQSGISFNASAVSTFNIINSSELKGFIFDQTGASNNGAFVGFLRPSGIPGWFNEGNYMYAFIPNTNSAFNFNAWICSSNNPFGTTGTFYFMLPSAGSFSYANSLNNNLLSLNQGLLLCQPTSGGMQSGEAGTTSTDFAFASCSNKNQLDILSYNNGSEEFLVLEPGSPGILIRIV